MSNIESITGLTSKQVEIYFSWDEIEKRYKTLTGFFFLAILADLFFLESYIITVLFLIAFGLYIITLTKRKKYYLQMNR